MKRLLVIAGLTLVLVLLTFIVQPKLAEAPEGSLQNQEQPNEVTKEKLPSVDELVAVQNSVIQPVIDEWVRLHPGASYSVVVQDPALGRQVAGVNQSDTYFSASLYKLYFAFLAWQDIESDVLVPKDNFYQSKSTLDCLDLMIRESDSPCGEAILALYDYTDAQTRLEELGLEDISVAGFKVSASDMAVLLQRIYDLDGISKEHAESLRTSMRAQIYDKGLKKGFVGYVEDKVGFSENGDWHDVGFVQLENGRWVIVSVLSKDALSTGVSGLGAELKKALQSL